MLLLNKRTEDFMRTAHFNLSSKQLMSIAKGLLLFAIILSVFVDLLTTSNIDFGNISRLILLYLLLISTDEEDE